MNKLMKKTLILVVVLILFGVGVNIAYKVIISPASKVSEEVIVTIPKGSNFLSITKILDESGVIKNKSYYQLYIKIMKPKSLKSGSHRLNKNMDLNQIIKELQNSLTINLNDIKITFNEGMTIKKYAYIIEENTNNSAHDVFTLLKDKEYLKSLKDEYWFITDDILNDKLYYSLEGYLEPNTYFFKNKDVTVKEIFKKLLDERLKSLNKLKDKIEKSNYNINEIMTLASIVEVEAKGKEDRHMVAQVFYNRLNKKDSLGSDVTTYYANQVEMNERDLKQAELNKCDNYNTRNGCLAGKLPIGPINNPSVISINAVLEPKKHDYYYFVSDKVGKIHYTKTYQEHQKLIAKLKSEGNWFVH